MIQKFRLLLLGKIFAHLHKIFLGFFEYQKSHKRYLEAYSTHNKQSCTFHKKAFFNKPSAYQLLGYYYTIVYCELNKTSVALTTYTLLLYTCWTFYILNQHRPTNQGPLTHSGFRSVGKVFSRKVLFKLFLIYHYFSLSNIVTQTYNREISIFNFSVVFLLNTLILYHRFQDLSIVSTKFLLANFIICPFISLNGDVYHSSGIPPICLQQTYTQCVGRLLSRSFYDYVRVSLFVFNDLIFNFQCTKEGNLFFYLLCIFKE